MIYQIADVDPQGNVGPILDPATLVREVADNAAGQPVDLRIILPDGTALVFASMLPVLTQDATGAGGGIAGPNGEIVIGSIEEAVAPAAGPPPGPDSDGSSQAFNEALITPNRVFGAAPEGPFIGLGQLGFEFEQNPFLFLLVEDQGVVPDGGNGGRELGLLFTPEDNRADFRTSTPAILGAPGSLVGNPDFAFDGGFGNFPSDLNVTDALEGDDEVFLSPEDGVNNLGQLLFNDPDEQVGFNAGQGDDTVFGNDDDDLIFGDTPGDVTVPGFAGDDTIDGGSNNDTIYGDAGDDVRDGGVGGDDTLIGGEGDDSLFGDAGDDFTNGALGGDDTIEGQLGNDLIVGDAGGSIDDDDLASFGGDDILRGGEGNDSIFGDTRGSITDGSVGGDDTIEGGLDDDIIYGDAGNNLAFGGQGGQDTVEGGDGNDTIYGDVGENIRNGSFGGDDDLNGGDDDDLIFGDAGLRISSTSEGGDDVIRGGEGNDTLYGDALTVQGAAGNDTIFGGPGDDTIFSDGLTVTGTPGDDTIDGGSGNDVIGVLFGDNRVVISDVNDGLDTINGFDNDGVAHDVLDLDALFDKLQLTLGPLDTAARVARVNVDQDGTDSNVLIDVSPAGDGSNEILIADITNTTAANFSIGNSADDDIFVGA